MQLKDIQDKNEVLAKMGLGSLRIKKGSRLAPLLALAVVLIAFLALRGGAGVAQLADVFVMGCRGAKGSPVASTSPLSTKPPPLRDACRTITDDGEVAKLAERFESLPSLEAKFHELGAFSIESRNEYGSFTNFTFAARSVVNAYLETLAGDFGKITINLLTTAGWLGLLSLLPGLIGLFYRNAFWPYFFFCFGVVAAINFWGGVSLVPVNAMPFSGEILTAIVAQLLLLFIGFRLRRYSSGASLLSMRAIPVVAHNTVLLLVLAVAGVTVFENWGGWVWSALRLDWWVYRWEFILIGLPVLYTLFRRSALWTGKGPKNIVMCLDGTSNTPDQFELGHLAQTNVFKLFSMLKPGDKKGISTSGAFDATMAKLYSNRQIAFYYTGVGNKYDANPVAQVLGQITGLGANDIVERAYLDLMRVYEKGDKIYIFGFSRGAAIARLLARAIDQRGAPKTVWTLRLFGRHWLVWKSKPSKLEDVHVPIAVLGCWDTVGAFGIAKTIHGINFQKIDMFKDLTVPDNVEQAYHMVALDEMRDSFEPTLMDPDPVRPGRIIEVWFSGDHANVGGGWGTPKLSDVTLDFLLRHVSSGYAFGKGMTPGDETWGLYLCAASNSAGERRDPEDLHPVEIDPDPLGQLRQWSSVLYNYVSRKLPLHAVISEKVFERMTRAVPVYAPQALFDHNEELDKKRATVDAAVARLLETKSLSDDERHSILEFKDKLRLIRWPQHLKDLMELQSLAMPEAVLVNPARKPS